MTLQEPYTSLPSEAYLPTLFSDELSANLENIASVPVWNENLDPCFQGIGDVTWRDHFVQWREVELEDLWKLAVQKELGVLLSSSEALSRQAHRSMTYLASRVKALSDPYILDPKMSEKRLKTLVRAFIIQYIEHRIAYSLAFFLAEKAVLEYAHVLGDAVDEQGLLTKIADVYGHRSHYHEWKLGWSEGWQHGVSMSESAA